MLCSAKGRDITKPQCRTRVDAIQSQQPPTPPPQKRRTALFLECHLCKHFSSTPPPPRSQPAWAPPLRARRVSYPIVAGPPAIGQPPPRGCARNDEGCGITGAFAA